VLEDLNPADKFGPNLAEPEPYYSLEEDDDAIDFFNR
jgi:hypothetical protein